MSLSLGGTTKDENSYPGHVALRVPFQRFSGAFAILPQVSFKVAFHAAGGTSRWWKS